MIHWFCRFVRRSHSFPMDCHQWDSHQIHLRRLQYFAVTLYVYVEEACAPSKWSERVPQRRLSWVSPFKQNRAFSGLPSFLPLPSVCVTMDGRRSPCHSTWKPHSELALQLLQGSTVWSCPVWLQTKHRGTHNLKPPDRDACNTNIFRNGRRCRTQTFHILCESLMSTEPFQSVCLMSAHFNPLLCMCVFFLSNFRTAPLLTLVANVSPVSLWLWTRCT